ncbi:hypothetical protein [Streptomyces tibetensis]|uniref:hypothetical protein n=1 Tax=Streptomyces tibetensis TaxID=2382123 RepID=UPI003F4CF842
MSAAHAEADGAAPVVSWLTLRAYADRDLVVLLGPASEPVRALSAGRPDRQELRYVLLLSTDGSPQGP